MLAVSAALLAMTLASIGPSTTVTDSQAVVETQRFQFRSDARVALHHFLVAWAAADAGEWPRYALYIAERGYWRVVLDDDEQRAWAAAVEAYGATVGRSYVFDDALIAVRDWAAGIATRDEIPVPERSLADALETALPIYRRHWWSAHDASNRGWIESVAPTVAAIEEDVVPHLEAAYGGRWPDEPVPVDIVVYANDVGAYSTRGRVTISGADTGNGMPQAVEMAFHESSHIDPLESSLRAEVEDAFGSAGGAAPDRFWHDMIFFTTADFIRLVFAEHGQPGYRHYGSFGLYQRGERWSTELPALERHWRPFLESASADESARRAALEALAADLLNVDPDPSGDLEAYRSDLETLSRDGSWWLASNAAYAEADGADAADAYGIRFWVEPGGLSAGGCLWSIRDGEPVAVPWRFYQAWDVAAGRPFFYQAHSSGTITGMGYLTDRDGRTTVLEQEFRSTDGGAVQRIRHRTEWPDMDTHVTHSADWSEGEWKPRRTYTWTRQTAGPVPCGPESEELHHGAG